MGESVMQKYPEIHKSLSFQKEKKFLENGVFVIGSPVAEKSQNVCKRYILGAENNLQCKIIYNWNVN